MFLFCDPKLAHIEQLDGGFCFNSSFIGYENSDTIDTVVFILHLSRILKV